MQADVAHGSQPALAPPPPHPPAPRRQWWKAEWLLFLAFVAPNFLLFALFTYRPMLNSVKLAMYRGDLLNPTKKWVAFANYEYLVGNDKFRTTLLNSVYFTVGTIGGTLILGLLAALLLNLPLRGRDGVRAAIFAPTLLSGAAISIVWVYMFDPRFGLIKGMLDAVGLASPNWLRDPDWAMPAIIIVYVWKNVGFSTVIYLAGLQAIPKDLYEAAKVDGAGAFWRFRSVTMPMLSPIVFFLVVTSVLSSFQAFDIIRVMTQGGPVDSTSTLIWYIYDQGFGNVANSGRASAASVVLFTVLLVFTLFQVRISERRVHYGQ